jgi:DNA-binding response OmpR family regulator
MSGRQTVLIVEDDSAARRMYRTALGFAGFDTIEAEDGLSALRSLDQYPVDVAILDVMLPTLSGLAVQQEIAANVHTRNIQVIIVTGSNINLDHVDVSCVLRKPISPDRLIDAVRNCLATARGVAT